MRQWDQHRAELYDTIKARAAKDTLRDCTLCGKPTRAANDICLDHELTLFDTDGKPASGSSQIGVDDPWPAEMF